MFLLKKRYLSALAFGLIALLYVFSVFTTFRPRPGSSDIGLLIAFGLTLAGGSGVFGLGYAFTVVLGGKASLGIVDFISRFNGSKHALEFKENPGRGLKNFYPLIYTPALVLLIALAIAVNIHYLDATFSVTFQSFPLPIIQDILSGLDIFLKPTTLGSFRYSIEIIPIMVFFVAIGGIIPSIVYPYLGRFKITSFNGVPFQKDIIYSALGTVFGLTILLSLINIIYGVLIGTQPHYYSYLLPTLLGFSLHYFLGAYVAREKAENSIEKLLRAGRLKRVFEGKISVEKSK